MIRLKEIQPPQAREKLIEDDQNAILR